MHAFNPLDMSHQGPFGHGQIFRPRMQGLTMVSGPAASGKTTIVQKLRETLAAAWPLDAPLPLNVALSLGFLDRPEELPSGGAPWPLLRELLEAGVADAAFLRRLAPLVERHLQHMMSSKVPSIPTKFNGAIGSSRELRIKIGADTSLNILDTNGRSLRGLFVAYSETVVLYLAGNRALRELLALDLPFVVGSEIDWVDHLLLPACLDACRNMASQVIVFREERDHEPLSPPAAIRLWVSQAGLAEIRGQG